MDNIRVKPIHSYDMRAEDTANPGAEKSPKTFHNNNEIHQMTEIFRDLSADDPEPEITEIESLCMRCHENGITRLLLTKIPFYKDVILMSFRCNHCGWENNELQPATDIQEKGILYELNVKTAEDLSRQIVKTELASTIFKEIDFEIPPYSQPGTITTIEGLLARALMGLESKYEELTVKDPVSARKLKTFLQNLVELKEGRTSFTVILRDCSGNSFIENFCAPQKDPEMKITFFERSHEENMMLGLVNSCESSTEDVSMSNEKSDFVKEEVFQFPTNCTSCNALGFTNMKVTQIPHFKDVIIMATNCDTCGHKTREVKSGSGIEPFGKKYFLKITGMADLKRYIVKSDTCNILIPDLELEVGSGSMNGRCTTVEGLLVNIRDEIRERNPFSCGDSAQGEMKNKLNSFFQEIDQIAEGKKSATLILDDPCGNSYLENLKPLSADHNLTVTEYERTPEQDEELGISDMKLENYEDS